MQRRAPFLPSRHEASGSLWRHAGLAVTAALALGACGGGGGEAPPGTDPVAGIPPPGTEAPLTATCGLPDFQAQFLAQLNARRAAGAVCGGQTYAATTPLQMAPQLQAAAAGHSRDMAANRFMSHVGSDGSTLRSRVDASGYAWTRLAENVAAGQSSVPAVVQAWMNSAGHCANIMNPQLVHVGPACERNPGTQQPYWTLKLGAPR